MLIPDNLQLIFERWKASLRDRPKSTEHVVSNFDELFDELLRAGATFEEAHTILPLAVKAHQPTPSLIRSYWKLTKSRSRNFDTPEKEFGENWCNDIANMATNAFYNSFPLPKNEDDDGEPKIYGQMSAKEYKLQRRQAESYPILDTEALENQLQTELCNPVKDILGESNDGNSK